MIYSVDGSGEIRRGRRRRLACLRKLLVLVLLSRTNEPHGAGNFQNRWCRHPNTKWTLRTVLWTVSRRCRAGRWCIHKVDGCLLVRPNVLYFPRPVLPLVRVLLCQWVSEASRRLSTNTSRAARYVVTQGPPSVVSNGVLTGLTSSFVSGNGGSVSEDS